MKITVTEQIFLDEFKNSSRADQFSREALVAIFAYITEAEGAVLLTRVQKSNSMWSASAVSTSRSRTGDTDELENYSNCDVIAELENSTVFYQYIKKRKELQMTKTKKQLIHASIAVSRLHLVQVGL